MCAREKDEPLLHFWFRQFKEEPLRVMIVATTGAMVWLYQDGNRRWAEYRQDMKEQNMLLVQHVQKTAEVLSKVEVRLGHLEHSVEGNRK